MYPANTKKRGICPKCSPKKPTWIDIIVKERKRKERRKEAEDKRRKKAQRIRRPCTNCGKSYQPDNKYGKVCPSCITYLRKMARTKATITMRNRNAYIIKELIN